MTPNKLRRNFVISLRSEQIRDLQNLIPWGTRSKFLEVIIDDLIHALKADKKMYGAILTRQITMEDYIRREEDE